MNNIDSASTVRDTAVHNMKGFELYVWENKGQLFFNLLPGTNRIKTAEEKYDSTTAINQLSIMQTKIDSLAVGEYLMVKASSIDTGRIHDLLKFSRDKGLNVQVE